MTRIDTNGEYRNLHQGVIYAHNAAGDYVKNQLGSSEIQLGLFLFVLKGTKPKYYECNLNFFLSDAPL